MATAEPERRGSRILRQAESGAEGAASVADALPRCVRSMQLQHDS